MRKLQTALDYKHRLTYLDNSLMTNLEVEEMSASNSRPKYVTAKIMIDPSAEPVFVTNCHLHYKTEPIRLRELDTIEKNLKTLFDERVAQIWTGDFNSLTREDYDDETWEDIARVRRENNWEPPKVAITNQIKKMNFEDCWTLVGRPEPYGTCRFVDKIKEIWRQIQDAVACSVTTLEFMFYSVQVQHSH